MKRSEALEKYRDKIEKAMVECYRCVLECGGSVQYKIYVWDDGEIEEFEQVQGDHARLVPNDAETRELFYVDTIEMPNYDPWDSAIDPPPEDDDAAFEEQEKEIIDWAVEEYKNSVSDKLDELIADAERDEHYDAE